jgi:hypothetical protein
MAFQVRTNNLLTRKKYDFKMCDPSDQSDCSAPVSHGGGEIAFPETAGRLNSVKITPTVAGVSMQDRWKIVLTDYIDDYKFSNGGAVIREITHRRGTGELVIRLLGGTTDWELIINNPTRTYKKKKQTTNVTIGDDD